MSSSSSSSSLSLSSSSSKRDLATASDFATTFTSIKAFLAQHQEKKKELESKWEREREPEQGQKHEKENCSKRNDGFSFSGDSATSVISNAVDQGQGQGQIQIQAKCPGEHQEDELISQVSFVEYDRVWHESSSPPSVALAGAEVPRDDQQGLTSVIQLTSSIKSAQQRSNAGPETEQVALRQGPLQPSQTDCAEPIDPAAVEQTAPCEVTSASESTGSLRSSWSQGGSLTLCNNWNDFFSKPFTKTPSTPTPQTTLTAENQAATPSAEGTPSSPVVSVSPDAIGQIQAQDHARDQVDNQAQPRTLCLTPVASLVSFPPQNSLDTAKSIVSATRNLLDDESDYEVLDVSKYPLILTQGMQRTNEPDTISTPIEHDAVAQPNTADVTLAPVSQSKWARNRLTRTQDRSAPTVHAPEQATPIIFLKALSSLKSSEELLSGPQGHSEWSTSLAPTFESVTSKSSLDIKKPADNDLLAFGTERRLSQEYQQARVHPASDIRRQPFNGTEELSKVGSMCQDPESWKSKASLALDYSPQLSMSENLGRFRSHTESQLQQPLPTSVVQMSKKIRYSRPFLLAFAHYKTPPTAIEAIQAAIKDGNDKMKNSTSNRDYATIVPLSVRLRGQPPATHLHLSSERFMGTSSGRLGGAVFSFKQVQPKDRPAN